MSLFRALVGVAIETLKLPVDAVVDVVTLGRVGDPANPGSAVIERLEKIKDEAKGGDK